MKIFVMKLTKDVTKFFGYKCIAGRHKKCEWKNCQCPCHFSQ